MKQIAYITDIHLDEEILKVTGVDGRKNWQRILNDVTLRNIDDIIFGGDIGEIGMYQWFFKSLQHFNLKITLGNHDSFNDLIKFYESDLITGQNQLIYAFEDDFLKYIFMDSSSGEISQLQFNWFINQLITPKKIMIFIHHPVLEINTVVDKLYPLKNREEIKSALLNLKNDVILFCGHYHMYDEMKENNITQILTMASSYQIEKNTEILKTNNKVFGYRIIQIDNAKVETELIYL